MIQIETTPEREAWVKITDCNKLTEEVIEDIEGQMDQYLPGLSVIYIGLKGIEQIDSYAITAMRKMAAKYMDLGCAVRYSTVPENLDEIIGNLTISSDG